MTRLRLKRRRVRDALERIGGFSVPELEITGAAVQNGYRNKVQFPVAQQNGRAVAGFYRARTHEVIPADGCKLQPECAERLKKGRDGLDARKPNPGLRRKKKHTGCVRHIYLRLGFVSGQALCCVVLNAKNAAACGVGGSNSARVPQTAGIVVSYNEKARQYHPRRPL